MSHQPSALTSKTRQVNTYILALVEKIPADPTGAFVCSCSSGGEEYEGGEDVGETHRCGGVVGVWIGKMVFVCLDGRLGLDLNVVASRYFGRCCVLAMLGFDSGSGKEEDQVSRRGGEEITR